ncbi:threonylcarbamoyl-AMP synthase [Candidatus Kaiserbacteria bacterium RIFCSPHIGHO2_01_FULL_56_24]|uniref:L-threonylcarbamoyladenylate synthase n=1 Tax=Candidatus Kaiserbacteria bacterium RIFCSPHIGHO2_01_FULL_56_24 TaxID=1798487 RepID=A0A1F6DEP7_9BACT|nr:MAG: threonylcarbamoyl-AMP synthase [Candidatus Kaiserbacteria bacterium RIFCSPHIGHO2_01_FULL_56_24]
MQDPDAPAEAAATLHAGGVILYPTDTLYGLGADALSDNAVAKINAIKGRDEKKPIHAIVADIEMAAKYGEINEIAFALACAYMPGPLTLILKKKAGVDTGIAKGIDTIGIRIPNDAFCLALAKEFGRPITTTSANKAGVQPERSVTGIMEQLGDNARLIDLAIDGGELPERLPSTVVDVSNGEIRILREGAIPAGAILAS